MGKHSCITWVPTLWGKCCDLFTKSKAKEIVFAKDSVCAIEGHMTDLPYDIKINILARLPAQCIFQLLESKLWQSKSNDYLHDLMKIPHFMGTHMDRATPTIVVQSIKESGENENDDIKLFLFDGKAEKKLEATSFDLSSCNNNAHFEGRVTLWGSYDGFLLFKGVFGRPTPFLCILNPITKEQVILTSPDIYFYVCAFYFHPQKEEYEVICVSYIGEQIWDFQILNLRSNHRRSVGSYSFPPSRKRLPVFINGAFYWMVDQSMYHKANGVPPALGESIVSFNMETGEFRTMEIPELFDVSPQHIKFPEEEFHLFEMEGELCLFGTSSAKEVVIWVCSYDNWYYYHIDNCWVKKHSITSPYQERNWNFRSYFRDFEYIQMKGEFIAYDRWDRDKQPLIYNLSLGTWMSFGSKGFEGDRFLIKSHTHSLVSLDAADPVIPLQC